KRRMNARGRPHTMQRWYPRTPNFGFRFAFAIIDFLGHVSPPPLRREGHAEELEQTPRLLVGLRRRHDADLQPAETVDLVVVDLGERDLLAQPEGVVAAAVEGAAGRAPEVTDAGQGEHRHALEEVPHALAAERDLEPDRVASPDLELGDRTAGLHDDRLLAGDHRQVARRGVDRLRVGQRLAEPDVDHDLLDPRHLVRVGVLELLDERRDDVRAVTELQPARTGRARWRLGLGGGGRDRLAGPGLRICSSLGLGGSRLGLGGSCLRLGGVRLGRGLGLRRLGIGHGLLLELVGGGHGLLHGGVAVRSRVGHAVTSIAFSQWLQTRTRRPSSRMVCRTRVGSLQFGQTSITFETSIGLAMSRIPPCWILGARSVRPWVCRGLVWRLAMLSPSTTTETGRADAGFQKPRRERSLLPPLSAATCDWAARLVRTRSTVPRLPA